MVSRPAIGLGILAIVCILTVTGAVAQSGYAISSPDSSSVPERSIDFQGETHTIDSRISAAPGEEITVDVSAPDEVYRVYLYNGDEQIEDRDRGDGGDGTFTFDLTDYEPGSYAITAYSTETGKYEAIIPVLVEGYDVSVNAPASVSTEEAFDVSIEVSEAASSGDPASVSAVFATDGDQDTVEASGGDGEYTASVAAGDLDPDEYTVYGIVQGDDQAFDRDELLGLAEGGSLTVEAADESGGGGGSGAGPGEETETPTESESGTATPAESGTATATAVDDSTAETETATTTEDEEATEAMDGTETEAQTTTEGNAAITPDDSGTEEQTTVADGPGFGGVHLGMALGAILGVIVLRRRTRTE